MVKIDADPLFSRILHTFKKPGIGASELIPLEERLATFIGFKTTEFAPNAYYTAGANRTIPAVATYALMHPHTTTSWRFFSALTNKQSIPLFERMHAQQASQQGIKHLYFGHGSGTPNAFYTDDLHGCSILWDDMLKQQGHKPGDRVLINSCRDINQADPVFPISTSIVWTVGQPAEARIPFYCDIQDKTITTVKWAELEKQRFALPPDPV